MAWSVINIVDKLKTHKEKKFPKRLLSSVESIVIHHTAGSSGLHAIAKYHVDGKDWPGIGYHFVIDKYGNTYRTNTLDTASYNVSRNNSKVIGVSLIGNYENDKLDSTQKKSLDALICNLRNILGYLPVKLHSDYKATLCPGKNLKEYILKKYN